MSGMVEPSRWAVKQFGEHAAEVVRHVVTGLVRGQRSARLVQEAAEREGAIDRRPYGGMWATRYNLVVEQFELADLSGYEAIKPRGASYSLAVINGRVLIPFRHATSLKLPISRAKLSTKIPREVSRANGVAPAPALFDIPDAAGSAGPSVAQAAAAAHAENLTVIYVGYVSNADSDEVLAAWWGTPTSLEDDGTMVWSPERLDMSIATTPASGGRHGDLRATGTDGSTAGFTQGDLPPLGVAPRTKTTQLPSAEAEETTAEAEDGDE